MIKAPARPFSRSVAAALWQKKEYILDQQDAGYGTVTSSVVVHIVIIGRQRSVYCIVHYFFQRFSVGNH